MRWTSPLVQGCAAPQALNSLGFAIQYSRERRRIARREESSGGLALQTRSSLQTF